MSHCVRNSSLTIIWNNLDLSNYKNMERKPGLKKANKNTCYNFKRNHVALYSKGESSYSYAFAERLLKSVSYMFFFF